MWNVLCYLIIRSELNLGVDVTGFTVVKYYRPIEEEHTFLKVQIASVLCTVKIYL